MRIARILRGPGVSALGTVGVEVAQQALAETRTANLPLVPYLDTWRWMFMAVAFGGIAVTIYARGDDRKKGGVVISGIVATLVG